MTVTPQRSALGAFVRSPLGVRGGGGKIELYEGASERMISFIGGGYSLGIVSPLNNSTNLGANFVKSGSKMSRSIISPKDANSRWYSTAARAAYLNGVWAVFGHKINDSGSAFEVYTSENRKDWTLKISVQSTNADFTYEGFSATPTGFYGWFQSSLSSTNWYSVQSSDGEIWTLSEIPQINNRVYNPMLGTITTTESGEPWVFGYDEPNAIMVGIGSTFISGFDFSKTPPAPIYGRSEDTKLYTSTDGVNWSLVHTHTSNLIFCAAGGGQMIAGNNTDLLYSSDSGNSWAQAGVGNTTTRQPVSAAYLGNSFVMYGFFLATDSTGSFETAVVILKNGVLSAKRPDSIISAIA